MNDRTGGAVQRRACAKVNLTLRVLGPRSDGFHELRSLVVGVGLADTIRFRKAKPGEISLRCQAPGVPPDDGNLAVQAARRLAEYTGGGKGACIELSKAVPVGAGLGGGSSDAAATLMELNRLWDAGLTDAELMELAADIGSDVPLFFRLPAAVIRGRGEAVDPVQLAWSGWMVLVFGGVEVSTGKVYAAWKHVGGSRSDSEAATGRIVRATTAAAIRPRLFNDLEPAVFRLYPAVERLVNRVRELCDGPARLSGAGSTVYTIYDEEQEARAFADMLRGRRLGAGVAVVRVPDSHTIST